MVKRPASQEMNPAEIRALIILIFIVSLLAENCNFDTLRKENPSALIPINSLTVLTGYNLGLTTELNNVSQVIPT
jgi:cohesin loading factor subunit SCC2